MATFITSSRTILMISDEELFIYSLDSKGVTLVESVPWGADDFEESVSDIISKNCGGKPVIILNDMVEQHYRKEKVPKVSALDKANVVKRKLKVAFPNYPVRAALPLKEKVSKTDASIAGSIYIFTAVPATEGFTKTMAAAKRSLAPIVGFFLLPIESTDMIKKLADKLSSSKKSKAQWTIFMGQHQNGGLRQIVIRNGELALTRMTPVVENDGDTSAWAGEVNQEFRATMSYLSRFGYEPSDGLNVILVSDDLSGEKVEELIEDTCDFYSVSADKAARLLKLNIGKGETDNRFADALHVAWAGRKKKFILPMRSRQLDTVSKPRKVASMITVLLVLGSIVQGFQYMGYLQSVSETSSEIKTLEGDKAQVDTQYDIEVKRKEELGYDIQLMQSSLALNSEFDSGRMSVLKLFISIGRALGRDMRIDRIDVARLKLNVKDKLMNNKQLDPSSFLANMQIIFPSKTNAEQGNREINKLSERLQKILPKNKVSVTKLLEDYEYSEEIVVETGDAQKKTSNQDYLAEISIRGPVK